MHSSFLLAILQAASVAAGGVADSTALVPDSAAMATAYADEHARELVRLARGSRDAIASSVFHYTATARQRLSVGVRGPIRDRILYRREVASRIEWWRDRPGRVEVQGARQAVPVARGGVYVPEDLVEWAEGFVPRPGDDRLWVNPVDDGFAWHPLVEGGEALYRYATGDTTVVRLPDGGEVRLVELLVTPRERDIRVVTGSFWIELDDHAVVQAVFRPAREFDWDRDAPAMDPEADDDSEDVPAFLRPLRFDARYIIVDYGLWEMRWWMPRLMAFEGHLQLGAVRIPVTMELLYTDYGVEGDRYGLPALPPLIVHLAGDSTSQPTEFRQPTVVVVPDDTLSLLQSDYLAGSFFDPGESIVSERELKDLADRIGAIPPPPWQLARPVVTPPWALGEQLLRYNRVEGLSVGARLDVDLSRVRLDLTARLGLADIQPRAELGVEIPGGVHDLRFAAYHRLAAMDPALRPFGFANSLGAAFFGRDDGQYFQASGAEARLRRGPQSMPLDLRFYAERQRGVDRSTDLSVSHLLGGPGFRANRRADGADQVGVAARLATEPSGAPMGFRWSAVVDITAEAGTYSFARTGLTLRGWAPLPGAVLGAAEIAAGTSVSVRGRPLPAQAAWLLGGSASLRGFDGGHFSGADYGRARIELASELPAVRGSVFADAGWTGRFDAWDGTGVALSAGIGGSLLDGLLRLDVARALRPIEQWRVDLYLDALF